MQFDNFFGLIKFFRNERNLDSLISGKLHFNTPEHYRLSGEEGISDKNESCSLSLRDTKTDRDFKFFWAGKEVPGIKALTMYSDDLKEQWLHCWTALHIPNDDSEITNLVKDINRMRQEFGHQFAFILNANENYNSFIKRLHELTNNKTTHGHVSYSDNRWNWSIRCKSIEYSYQREYRFCIGFCNHTDTEQYEIIDESGFQDYISKNPVLEVIETDTQLIRFHLDIDRCFTEVCI